MSNTQEPSVFPELVWRPSNIESNQDADGNIIFEHPLHLLEYDTIHIVYKHNGDYVKARGLKITIIPADD